jgi:hypothetical protein
VEALDRYLEAVRAWLPREQQADIVAELAEDLRCETDERQRALGRPLSEDEVLALLKRRGHPMSVAEGYLPLQHLIGPAMLPAYWRTVKIAVSVILAIAVVLCAIFSGPARHAAPALSSVTIWVWLFGVFALAYVGMFTLIFAAVERRNRRAQAGGTWDPRDPDGFAPADPEVSARRSMRANAVAEVVVDLILLSWWLAVHPVAIPELGVVLTPAWRMLHWPVAIYLGASIAVGLADALRPSWTRPRIVSRLAVDAFALLLVLALLGGSPWVQVTSPAVPAATAVTVERWLNLTWLVTLVLIAVLCVSRMGQLTLRLLRHGAVGRGTAPRGGQVTS